MFTRGDWQSRFILYLRRKLAQFAGQEHDGGASIIVAALAVLAVTSAGPPETRSPDAAHSAPEISSPSASGSLFATPGFPDRPVTADARARATAGTDRKPGTTAMAVARSFIGKSEREHAALIGDFIVSMTGSDLDVRETPWCAAFMNAVLKASGIEGTGSLSARSYLGFGIETLVPRPGDIAVFSRGDPLGQAGHVGFYESEIVRSGEVYIRVMGGNQGDAVSHRLYPKSRLLGYRRLPDLDPGPNA